MQKYYIYFQTEKQKENQNAENAQLIERFLENQLKRHWLTIFQRYCRN